MTTVCMYVSIKLAQGATKELRDGEQGHGLKPIFMD